MCRGRRHTRPKENIMPCTDNKHFYTSAFFIPEWLLCRTVDFINGSLHGISNTARCNHYSNTRIASIVKHMRDEIEYAWVSRRTRKWRKYTRERARRHVRSQSLNSPTAPRITAFLKLQTCEASTQENHIVWPEFLLFFKRVFKKCSSTQS